MMTGLDGLTTLKKIKKIDPLIPIIMITKNEEEWLMEEAIASQISNYLTKPVNPSQILIACKKVLDNKSIKTNKVLKEFIDFFKSFDNTSINSINDWYSIYNQLCNWSLQFDKIDDTNIINMFYEQKSYLNRNFSNFIISNYKNWINNNSKDSPILSHKIFDEFLSPIISSDKKLVFIIIDCLRLDQWKQLSKLLYPSFRIKEDFHLSILPTATPFARNAIFSGLLPNDLKEQSPDIWNKMYSSNKLNGFEDILFKNLLHANQINKTHHYTKITDYNEGNRFYNKINDFKNIDILTIVVNFVDLLGHSRSESNILKELIPNESAYRHAIQNWFEKSWLNDSLNVFKEWNADIVITADHGNTQVNKPVKIKADQTASLGLRYKYGRNLTSNEDAVFKIKNPIEYKLPMFEINTEYVIAKNDNFFVYNNDYHKYVNIFKNTFQHGGISLDEMVIPVAHLRKK